VAGFAELGVTRDVEEQYVSPIRGAGWGVEAHVLLKHALK